MTLSFTRRRQLFLLIFGAPAVLYVIAVAIWPLAQGLSYSFYDYSLLKPDSKSFVGFDNYRALVTNDAARNSIITTVIFTVSAVAVEFLVGLGLALLLWRESFFRRTCLALLLIPVTVTPIVVGDVDGVVIVPRLRIAETLKHLATVRKLEAGLEAKVKAGLKKSDIVDSILKPGTVKEVD
jgi:ABC-type sugar transport system permease subunit